MKKNIFKIFSVAILLFIFLPINLNYFSPNLAQAASDTSIVIQPAKIEITASPGQKIARSFSLINRSNFNVRLKLIVKDYRQISEDGKLEFYTADKEQASSWLVPQFLEIGLKPLETKDVGIVANVPQNISGGGHYGAILFQPVGSSGNLNMSNFGELVLLTVTGGDIKTTATIKGINFGTGLIQQGNPVNFNFKMQNTGNTHFDAQARLVLKNWLGKEIGNYNIGQLTVYPKTSRTFQWRWNGTPYMGLYRADVMLLNPSLKNKFTTVDGMWFILFPWPIGLAVLVLAAGVFAVIKYRQKLIFNLKFIIGPYTKKYSAKINK